MKKLFSAAAIAFLSCGCAAAPFTAAAPDFDRSYTVEAEIQYGDIDAQAEVTRNSSGSWQFDFNEPQELMGISISIDGSDITASLGELSVSTPKNSTWSSIPAAIAESIDSLPDIPAESFTEQDGILTINTTLNEKTCAITADKATGRLISLKYPYGGFAVYFSDQQDITPLTPASETEEQIGLVTE